MSVYDEYLFWYVSKKELPFIGVALKDMQKAYYITHRWMPYRRPASILRFVPDVAYPDHFPKYLPGTGTDPVDALLLDVEEDFGPGA